MPCPSFEDRLLDYDELSAGERESVHAHVVGCTDCREYLEALTGIDAQLTKLYAGARVSPEFFSAQPRSHQPVAFRISAETRLHKPSFIPEVLDFLGWASVIAVVVCAALVFVPIWAFQQLMVAIVTPTLIGAPVIAALAAAWIGLRSYAELKR